MGHIHSPFPPGLVLPGYARVVPSGDSSGVRDAANLTAALAEYDRVQLLPGDWFIASTVTIGLNQYVTGTGPGATIVAAVAALGTNPVFELINATGIYQAAEPAGLGGLTVDISATAAGVGVQAGDIAGLQLPDLVIKLGTSGGTGLHLINQTFWTEQLNGRVYVQGAGNGIVFDVGGADSATGSFDRTQLDAYLNMAAGGNGVVVQNGAFITGRLGIYGNMAAGASGGAVLTITGSAPAGHPASVSSIGGSNNPAGLWIDVECDGAGTACQTINAGASNSINAAGVIDFNGSSAMAASNIQGRFKFQGPVSGDSTLVATSWLGEYDQPSGTYATLESANGGFITISPGAPVTGGILAAGSFAGQVVTIANESANSYTFAASATSNVADGTADVIAPLTAARYIWSTSKSLWYRS
jgi:hypothetical protein